MCSKYKSLSFFFKAFIGCTRRGTQVPISDWRKLRPACTYVYICIRSVLWSYFSRGASECRVAGRMMNFMAVSSQRSKFVAVRLCSTYYIRSDGDGVVVVSFERDGACSGDGGRVLSMFMICKWCARPLSPGWLFPRVCVPMVGDIHYTYVHPEVFLRYTLSYCSYWSLSCDHVREQ